MRNKGESEWDMEMIGERKNHCKLKNFFFSFLGVLNKKFLFIFPVTLSIYKKFFRIPARTVMGKMPLMDWWVKFDLLKVMEIDLSAIWFVLLEFN